MPLYVTHVYAHSPHHLPKNVTQNQPVNHIGSSDEPPIMYRWLRLKEDFKSMINYDDMCQKNVCFYVTVVTKVDYPPTLFNKECYPQDYKF